MAYLIEDGLHMLTGIGQTSIHDGWNDTDIDGVVLQIDGKNYVVYEDREDNYRSYGEMRETDEAPKVTFPAEPVYAWNKSDSGMDENQWRVDWESLELRNVEGELVLEIGTDHSDTYYPWVIFHWHPENLTINKEWRSMNEKILQKSLQK